MAEQTSIEWTDATWNPITGCSVVSPGCTNCYAMGLAGTRLKHHPSRKGLTVDSKAGPVWNGTVRLNKEWLTQPLQWKRPRMIFVCAHGDLFHESVPDAWIDRVYAVMALCPQHTFQVLTKRSARMRAYMARLTASGETRWAADILCDAAHDAGVHEESAIAVANWINGFSRWRHAPPDDNPLDGSKPRWPLSNVWLGVSAEDQTRADERVPDLLATPAAVRFVSAEPLLGRIDFSSLVIPDAIGGAGRLDALSGQWRPFDPDGVATDNGPCLDWIIGGGESGPKARITPLAAARRLHDQCSVAGVPFFWKQNGEWLAWGQTLADGNLNYLSFGKDPSRFQYLGDGEIVSRVGKKGAGRLLDGIEHNGMPEVRP